MKLYDFTRAPNPRRVRIFLGEKGITVPMEQVDLFTGANRTPEALRRNPYGGLPVLELDDGTCIAESVAICRYFEDQHPQPALMGVDAKDRAVVEMWNRRNGAGFVRSYPPLFAAHQRDLQDTHQADAGGGRGRARGGAGADAYDRRLHRRAPLYRPASATRSSTSRRWPRPGSGGRRADSGFRPRKPDALVRRGVGAAERPRLMGTVASAISVPAASGMFRKSRAFLPRYQKFESISLQRRVRKLSVPLAISIHLSGRRGTGRRLDDLAPRRRRCRWQYMRSLR